MFIVPSVTLNSQFSKELLYNAIPGTDFHLSGE